MSAPAFQPGDRALFESEEGAAVVGVPDVVWRRCIEPREQNKIGCWCCFEEIAELIGGGEYLRRDGKGVRWIFSPTPHGRRPRPGLMAHR